MKKVWYFTPVLGSYEMERFSQEAKISGWKFQPIQYKHISVEFNKNSEFRHLGKRMEFRSGDIAIMRNPKFLDHNDPVFYMTLLYHLRASGVRASNSSQFMDLSASRDKLFQYYLLDQEGLPIIRPTFFMHSNHLLQKKLDGITQAFIVKPRSESKGVGIFRINKREDFFMRAKDCPAEGVLLQKFIPNRFDLRVICTPDRIIGAMKRTAKEGKVVNNFSAGGSVVKYELEDPEIIETCQRTCKLFRCDYLGVDIILSGKRFYILEVNFFCHVKGFEQATGINFPQEIHTLMDN